MYDTNGLLLLDALFHSFLFVFRCPFFSLLPFFDALALFVELFLEAFDELPQTRLAALFAPNFGERSLHFAVEILAERVRHAHLSQPTRAFSSGIVRGQFELERESERF